MNKLSDREKDLIIETGIVLFGKYPFSVVSKVIEMTIRNIEYKRDYWDLEIWKMRRL